MDSQRFPVLCIIFVLIVICESGVIPPRNAPKEDLPGDGKSQNDKRIGWPLEEVDPAYFQPKELDSGLNPDAPESEENEDANEMDEERPEIFPPNYDDIPEDDIDEDDKVPDKDEPAGDVLPHPFDDDDDLDDALDSGKGPKIPDQKGPADDGRHPKPPVHEDEDEKEDKKPSGDDDDVIPVDDVDKDLGEEGSVPDFLGTGIFDSAFFNLDTVRKYFHQLESALEHVFKQTVEEAKLLNGTYANNTEEEVDINGKKYVVHKSIIKGGDDDSSIYVETLSSKPKEERKEGSKKVKIDRR